MFAWCWASHGVLDGQVRLSDKVFLRRFLVEITRNMEVKHPVSYGATVSTRFVGDMKQICLLVSFLGFGFVYISMSYCVVCGTKMLSYSNIFYLCIIVFISDPISIY